MEHCAERNGAATASPECAIKDGIMTATSDINRERIAATEAVIRPHIRRTPVVEADLADFGLPAAPVMLQARAAAALRARSRRAAPSPICCCARCRRPASSRPRAAITARRSPTPRMRLGVPATIFVPDISSPAKIERIRGYGAELVVGGERYADALAASEAHVARDRARCRCTPSTRSRPCSARARVGLELEQQAPDLDTLLVAVGGGGLIGGIAAWYAGRVARHRRRAGAGADAAHGAARRAGRSTRRPAASPPTRSRRGASAS